MSRPQTGQRMKQPASLEGFGSTTSPMISPLSGRWRSSMADRLLPVLGDHVPAQALNQAYRSDRATDGRVCQSRGRTCHGTPSAPPRCPQKSNPHSRAAGGNMKRLTKIMAISWAMHAADRGPFQADGSQRRRLGSNRSPPGADSR